MQLSAKQEGVTLLEVLVGFVIFTSSLVAILDYVSGQIYHSQLSGSYLEKIQLIYERSSSWDIEMDPRLQQTRGGDEFGLTISGQVMESATVSGGELLLNRYRYSVTDNNNATVWTVLKYQ